MIRFSYQESFGDTNIFHEDCNISTRSFFHKTIEVFEEECVTMTVLTAQRVNLTRVVDSTMFNETWSEPEINLILEQNVTVCAVEDPTINVHVTVETSDDEVDAHLNDTTTTLADLGFNVTSSITDMSVDVPRKLII